MNGGQPSSARLDPSRASPAPAALAEDLTPRFELGAALGRGGFGAVHRARERATGREVALKLLHREGSASAVERFLREAAVAAGLDHPGILKVHALGTHAGRPCIVFELVDGAPLSDAARTLDHRRRVELVRDAARAVGHAHACGVVHRDLKPDNILVDASGRVRVADFGLAAVEGADRLTQTGAAVGTPTHMAPEQFDGRTSASPAPAVDVWSLGVVLYEVLTGRLPFEAPSLIALAALIDAARPTPPRRIDPTIPAPVEAVILRALSRDPARRHADAAALADALDEALAGRGGRRGGRAPLMAAGALAVALVGAGVALAPGRAAPASVGERRAPTPEPSTPATATEPGSTPAARRYAARRLAVVDAPGAHWAVWLDDASVVTGGPDDDLRLYDASTGEERRRWPHQPRDGVPLPSGRGALLIGHEGALLRLDVDSGVVAPVLAGEVGSVEALAAGGEHLVALEDAAAHVLDATGTRRVASLPSRGESMRACVSPDGRRVAISTAGRGTGPDEYVSGPVLVFDLDAPDRAGRPVTIPGKSKVLRFSADGRRLYVGSSSQQILVIDPDRGNEPIGELTSDDATGGLTRAAHRGNVKGLAVSRDGARLYSCSELSEEGRTELRVWDLAREVEVVERRELVGRPTGLDLAPGGGALLLGTEAHGVYVLPVSEVDPSAARAGRARAGPPGALASRQLGEVAGSRWGVALDGGRVLTGGDRDHVRLWDAGTGAELRAWPELRGAVAAAGTGDRAVVACLPDRVVRLDVDAARASRLLRLERPLGAEPELVCARSVGRALLCAGDGAWTLLFDTATGEPVARLPAGTWAGVALSPDGERVLACDVQGETRDDRVGALVLFQLGGAPGGPELRIPIAGVARQLRFAPDGRRFFVGTTLQHVAAASLDQVELGRFSAGGAMVSHAGRIRALAVTPDGRTLLSAARLADGGGSEVQPWDVGARAPSRQADRVPGDARVLDVSPDGRFYVVGTIGGGVHVRPLAP